MPLLSNNAARVALQKCILKQQGRCYICGEIKFPLVLEHKDNNRENNPEDGSNWGAACTSCNTKKGIENSKKLADMKGPKRVQQPSEIDNKSFKIDENKDNKRVQHSTVCVSVCDHNKSNIINNGNDDLYNSGELLKSEIFRPKVKEWIKKIIKEEKEPEVSRLRNGGAELFGVNQITIGRWLDAMCSPEGEYEYFINCNGKKCVKKKNKIINHE